MQVNFLCSSSQSGQWLQLKIEGYWPSEGPRLSLGSVSQDPKKCEDIHSVLKQIKVKGVPRFMKVLKLISERSDVNSIEYGVKVEPQ